MNNPLCKHVLKQHYLNRDIQKQCALADLGLCCSVLRSVLELSLMTQYKQDQWFVGHSATDMSMIDMKFVDVRRKVLERLEEITQIAYKEEIVREMSVQLIVGCSSRD